MDFTDWVWTIGVAVVGAVVMGVVVVSLFAYIGPVPEVVPCTP